MERAEQKERRGNSLVLGAAPTLGFFRVGPGAKAATDVKRGLAS